VPDFWATAIKNNQMMMQYMREKDQETLKHLSNVVCSEANDPPTTTVELTFRENEFFTNEKLTLKVQFKDESKDEVVETFGTPIDWKDGKDITCKKINKKQKNKKTGETRQIVKTVPAESFYHCFESKKAPDNKDDDDEDEETEKLMDAIDESMQIAMDFNDLYMWEALEYYLNFGSNHGDFMDMAGMGGEGDDDDDEDEAPKPKKQKKKPAEAGAEGTEEQK
jgi:nucleosome assembly protein 1-like 1